MTPGWAFSTKLQLHSALQVLVEANHSAIALANWFKQSPISELVPANLNTMLHGVPQTGDVSSKTLGQQTSEFVYITALERCHRSPESAPKKSVPSHTQASSLSGLRGCPLQRRGGSRNCCSHVDRCLKARATEFVSQKDVEPLHCGILASVRSSSHCSRSL